jgi:N-methylhydantoinase B
MLTTPPTVRLQQLSSEMFAAEYGCERLTAAILASRFQYIIEHVCGRLLATAFSPIIRDFYDFSAALVGPPDLDYQTPAVAKSMALFFGSIRDAVANAIEEFGPEDLREGDILISNDPYRSGTHVNDVCFMRPVHWEGSLVSVLTIRAHMMDMGGIVPGGFTGTKKNVYETGLVIPPTLLYRDNRMVKSTLSLIYDNTRFGDLLVLDFESIRQSLALGERLLHETIQRHGPGAVRSTIKYVCDVSAETMADALAAFPNGVYEGEDFIDCDAVDASVMYRVAVRVTKFGSRAEVDLAGSSQQARTCINGAWPDVKSAVAIALKFLLDPMSPFTSAVTRSVDIVAPPGTVTTAMPPNGAVMLYWEALVPTVAAVCRALNAALGENAFAGTGRALTMHHCTGVRADGTQWSSVFNQNGGWGATRDGDADSAQKGLVANFMDTPTEALERTIPALIMRREYVPDSGGPGRFRGGAGSATDSFFLEPSESHVSSNHTRSAPGNGAFGGCPGSSDGVWVWEPSGDDPATPRYISLKDTSYATSTPVCGRLDPSGLFLSPSGQLFHWGSRGAWTFPAGAAWRSITAGGGGWGDPLAREPEAVARDVRDGYVSIDGARRDYGVVILGDPDNDPEELTIDVESTLSLRADRADCVDSACPEATALDDDAVIAAPVAAVTRDPVDSRCPECGSEQVLRYPVLADNGWQMVDKCQVCLCSLARRPWRRLGFLSSVDDHLQPGSS